LQDTIPIWLYKSIAVILIQEIVEKDIPGIVHSAQTRDLNQKIELNGKDGFFRELSYEINLLINTLPEVFNDVGHSMKSISNGNLSRTMDGEYSGEFANIQGSFNTTLSYLFFDALNSIISSFSTLL
jgi:methyl-accepting chemotaxis protein